MEVNHSERYLERRASIGLIKPIREHIAHFKQRLRERFDITFSTRDYYNLLERIGKDSQHIYKINGGNTLMEIEIQGKTVWVLYGAKNDKQPARLKTALVPWIALLTPDKLSNHYDHKTFTVVVKKVIEEFIKLSETVDIYDPVDKKRFFTRTDIPKNALAGAYFYKKFNGDKLRLINIAVRYLKEINKIDPDEDE